MCSQHLKEERHDVGGTSMHVLHSLLLHSGYSVAFLASLACKLQELQDVCLVLKFPVAGC